MTVLIFSEKIVVFRKPYCLPIPELAALGRAAGNMGMGPSIASGGPLGSQWSKKSQV